MKKLILAFAVIALAMASQAASTKWTVTNSRLPTVADKTQSYSGLSTTTSDTIMTMTISLLYADEILATETTGSTGNFVGKIAMTQAKTIEITTAAGSTSPIFSVLTSVTTADGTYTYTGTATGSLANVVNGAKDATLAINMNTAGTWAYTPSQTTPEPTSGLLLVLGMAGLALRRRRA